jgi:hypothetical protein
LWTPKQEKETVNTLPISKYSSKPPKISRNEPQIGGIGKNSPINSTDIGDFVLFTDKSYIFSRYYYDDKHYVSLVCINYRLRYLWIGSVDEEKNISVNVRTDISYLKIGCNNLQLMINSGILYFTENESVYLLRIFREPF